jgi:NAD-dependent SIR2 family protein deacetylase
MEHNKAMGDIAEKAQLASANPTSWHHLQAHLAERNDQPVLRIYTQNIDGIEDSFLSTKVQNPKTDALEADIVVYLHGNLRWARCRKCNCYEMLDPRLYQTNANVRCPKCIRKSRNNSRLKNLEVETLQPNVVLYDVPDDNPNQLEKDRIITIDLANKIQKDPSKVKSKYNYPSKAQALPDRLVVCGTSARLSEVVAMIRDFAEVVHQKEGGQVIWIGLSKPPKQVVKYIDEVFLLDCQNVARYYLENVNSEVY